MGVTRTIRSSQLESLLVNLHKAETAADNIKAYDQVVAFIDGFLFGHDAQIIGEFKSRLARMGVVACNRKELETVLHASGIPGSVGPELDAMWSNALDTKSSRTLRPTITIDDPDLHAFANITADMVLGLSPLDSGVQWSEALAKLKARLTVVDESTEIDNVVFYQTRYRLHVVIDNTLGRHALRLFKASDNRTLMHIIPVPNYDARKDVLFAALEAEFKIALDEEARAQYLHLPGLELVEALVRAPLAVQPSGEPTTYMQWLYKKLRAYAKEMSVEPDAPWNNPVIRRVEVAGNDCIKYEFNTAFWFDTFTEYLANVMTNQQMSQIEAQSATSKFQLIVGELLLLSVKFPLPPDSAISE
jgi:hypothetical protein